MLCTGWIPFLSQFPITEMLVADSDTRLAGNRIGNKKIDCVIYHTNTTGDTLNYPFWTQVR